MHIESIQIEHFRNLQPQKLHFSSGLNIIYGDNAAGKSSFLEALYMLGNSRSFRTSKHNKLIQFEHKAFTLFSEFYSSRAHHKLGLSRDKSSDTQIKLNGDRLKTLSQLATIFPVQIIAPEYYEFLSLGPSIRRKALDWGVFHVEHPFIEIWKRCNKALYQRNKLLKSGCGYGDLLGWDAQIVPLSEQITSYRLEYCEAIQPIFNDILSKFLDDVAIEIRLYKGWSQSEPLEDILKMQFDKDLHSGYTHSSILKADLRFYIDGKPAVDCLSRGQQKLLITAFKLAQLYYIQQQGSELAVFLIDDIGAELDKNHQLKLLEYLAAQPKKQQIFISCVHLDPLKSLIKGYNEVKLFHVEHGVIAESPLDPIKNK